ncbi:MAG: hypothetical protein M3Z01_00840 [Thermoproteota archaeon]|nr:hypothetical protein [Thermoproteota archaeon]
MSLKDLNLKVSHDSNEDEILNSFYIIVLSHSPNYNRISEWGFHHVLLQ